MSYVERKVRSAPGLSQEEALDSLQSHPNFRAGTKIASLRRRGDRWVALLQVPKTAGGFPPPGDGDGDADDGPPKPDKAEESEDADALADALGGPEDSEGPPKPGEDEKKPGKGGTEEEILHVLTEILHALKGGPVGPGLGGPDDLGPGPDALGGPPPPHGGPGAGAKPPGKLGPGEVLPHQTPIGTPAFSSTSDPLYQRIAKVAGRQRHIPVSSPVGLTIKQAKAQLEPYAQHFGYRVAQIRYCGPSCTCQAPGSSKIHALLEAGE